MVVKVKDIFTNSIIRAAGDDWWDLRRYVNKLVSEHPDEQIVLDFERVYAQWDQNSVAASDILKHKNVEMVFYNNPEIVDGLRVFLAYEGRPLDSVRNVTVVIDTGIKKKLTPKELRIKEIRDSVENMCRKAIPYMGILRVRIDTWKDCTFSIVGTYEQIDAVLGAAYDSVKDKINNGENITRVIVHFGKHDVSTHLAKDIGEYYCKFATIGVELNIETLRNALNEQIRIRTQIGLSEWDNEQKIELIRKLGKGRVGILTRFKNHKSQNIELRLNGEITNQWVAIIKAWSRTRIKFALMYYRDIKPRIDAWWQSPEEEYELKVKYKDVDIKELGLEHACIGRLWHFNRFDASANGVKYKETLTRHDLSFDKDKPTREKVSVPEYIRRALLSNAVDFNEESLKADTIEFEMTLRKIEEKQ